MPEMTASSGPFNRFAIAFILAIMQQPPKMQHSMKNMDFIMSDRAWANSGLNWSTAAAYSCKTTSRPSKRRADTGRDGVAVCGPRATATATRSPQIKPATSAGVGSTLAPRDSPQVKASPSRRKEGLATAHSGCCEAGVPWSESPLATPAGCGGCDVSSSQPLWWSVRTSQVQQRSTSTAVPCPALTVPVCTIPQP